MEISFKAKPFARYDLSDGHVHGAVKVPRLKRSHVDMDAARSHPKYSGIANSQIFENMLQIISKKKFPDGHIRLGNLPEGVSAKKIGPLVEISWNE